ncbi:MAG: hypothetical protein J4469_04870 [Candidatus Aenigmarchaeota archaeon]|nr:hypothetical protein [Candidatus Aenigmarchaeota archaeon]
MVMENKPKRDWRDKTATKIAGVVVGVALLAGATYGGSKLARYSHEKFCQQYGWLRDAPIHVKESVADAEARESRLHITSNSVDQLNYRGTFLRNLRACK